MFVYAVCSGEYNQFSNDFTTIINIYTTKKKAEDAASLLREEWKHGKGPYCAITNPNYFEVQKIEVN